MEKETERTFLKFIAYLQIIGIIFVVVGHSFHEYPDGKMGHTMLLYRMMSSFRMPLFMFVSGFLMVFTMRLRGNSPLGFRAFARNKLKRLILPFAVLSVITFFPRAAMSHMADDVMDLSWGQLCRSLFFMNELVIPFFWFLQASFVLLLFSYAVIRLGARHKIPDRYVYGFLVALFTVLPMLPIPYVTFWSTIKIVNFGIFFALGAAYSRYAAKVDAVIGWTSVPLFVGFAAVWAFAFAVTEGTQFDWLCSLAGIAMCISFAKILEHRSWGFLDHLTGTNYMIFLLSWYFNVACQQVLHHFTDMPWWVYTIMSIVFGVYIPVLAYRLMQRHAHRRPVKAIAFMLGQNLKKRTSDKKR